MRRLFQIGVDGVLWNLIYSLHSDAQTTVRWMGQTSERFEIHQGVRQGGSSAPTCMRYIPDKKKETHTIKLNNFSERPQVL